MRTQLIAVTILALAINAYADSLKTMDIITRADDVSQIKQWASKQGTSSRAVTYKMGGLDVLVLLIDTASGSVQEDIYIFYFERDHWRLSLARYTKAEVKVEKTKDAIVFKNAQGKVIVEQPFNTLRASTSER